MLPTCFLDFQHCMGFRALFVRHGFLNGTGLRYAPIVNHRTRKYKVAKKRPMFPNIGTVYSSMDLGLQFSLRGQCSGNTFQGDTAMSVKSKLLHSAVNPLLIHVMSPCTIYECKPKNISRLYAFLSFPIKKFVLRLLCFVHSPSSNDPGH